MCGRACSSIQRIDKPPCQGSQARTGSSVGGMRCLPRDSSGRPTPPLLRMDQSRYMDFLPHVTPFTLQTEPPPFDQAVVKLLFHADGTGGRPQSTWLACVCVLSVINRHLEKSLAEWQRPTQVRDRSPHSPVLQQTNSYPSMMHA